MGRPIKKKFFRDYTGANLGIKVSARKTDTARDSFIFLQKGSSKYNVTNATDGIFKAKLVSSLTGPGQALMVGFEALSVNNEGVYTVDVTAIPIRKLTARRATTFASVVYKWQLINDGDNDYIVLIPTTL